MHASRPPRLVLLGPPHPWAWLASDRPDRHAFVIEVVHGSHPPAWCRWAAERYRDRWSDVELVRTVRYAARRAPLPAWAAALLRQNVRAA